jgi:hypothetical protein
LDPPPGRRLTAAEVRKPDREDLRQQNVLWFQVSVCNLVVVEV